MKTTSHKSITLITTPGKSLPVAEQLFQKGLKMVDVHNARGSFVGGPTHRDGSPVEVEQEMLTCIAPASEAENVFALIRELGQVDEPNGGFMFMQDLNSSTETSYPT